MSFKMLINGRIQKVDEVASADSLEHYRGTWFWLLQESQGLWRSVSDTPHLVFKCYDKRAKEKIFTLRVLRMVERCLD